MYQLTQQLADDLRRQRLDGVTQHHNPQGGIPMNAPNNDTRGWRNVISEVLDYTPFPYLRKGRRGSWLTPPRPGIYRLIPPWAYRHLRFYAVGHIAGGSIAAAAGLTCLSYGVYGWAAFLLVLAALNLAGGSWYLTIDRSAPART
jgi:hypothetical protein